MRNTPFDILPGICFLRSPPQDLPASRVWLAGALAAYAFADVVMVLPILPPGNALLAAAVDTLLLAAATLVALQWRGFENRVTQTLMALAGSGALISLLAWSGSLLVGGWLSEKWVWAASLLWYTLVIGHILRHALSISLAAGVAAGLMYIILSMSVTSLFIPEVPPAGE